jgi:hypothetical protein
LHCVGLRQFSPAHFAGCVDEKFRGASDIAAIFSASGEKQIVAPDGFGVAIGKQGKGQAGFLSQFARFFWSVCADCDWMNPRSFKRTESVLYPP